MKNKNQIPTESRIMKLLNVSSEDLFWIRQDCGVKYLKDVMGEEIATRLIKSKNKEFWNWYLKIWEINDKSILHQFRAMPERLTLEDYIKCHLYKAKRYCISNSLINLKSINKNERCKSDILKIS